jgi:hypothetical protein
MAAGDIAVDNGLSSNAQFSGGTTNSYSLALAASGTVSGGIHGCLSVLNKGPNSLDYFVGGHDSYGTLTSGVAVTLTINNVSNINLDAYTLRSGVSPLSDFDLQVKSSVLNQSGLCDIRTSLFG